MGCLLLMFGLPFSHVFGQVAKDDVSSASDSVQPLLYYGEETMLFSDTIAAPALDVDSIRKAMRNNIRKASLEIEKDDYFERFNPVPAKAVWYAALFPGGGQIYNRKYWKLPIIYGGFLGLLYGYKWNQKYYRTYSNAYRDLVLGSPNASYMSFLPPNYNVRDRYDYLERTFKRKKNSYRTYRDYCVVGMLGVYLVAMVDAYVDASLYHFDVSPQLDAYNRPSLMVGYKIDF